MASKRPPLVALVVGGIACLGVGSTLAFGVLRSLRPAPVVAHEALAPPLVAATVPPPPSSPEPLPSADAAKPRPTARPSVTRRPLDIELSR